MSKQSNVFILYTGGTVGMATNQQNELVPKPLNELIKSIPSWDNKNQNLDEIKLNNGITLGFGTFEEPLDSSNVTPNDWIIMADKIAAIYHHYDGFVILHGTDTMAYTASGLAFIFENLSKPVVLTGSQLPMSDERTDALMNLVNAVYIAGWKATGLACIPEVVVCFANRILRGCRTTKISSTAWAGFDSPNFPHLGEMGEHIHINEHLLRPMPEPELDFQINRNLETAVLDITINPSITVTQLEAMMSIKGIKAVLLRTYGTGNAPSNNKFLTLIKKMIDSGKIIVNISQCTQGLVKMGRYATSAGLLKCGVISGSDMTAEAALSKLYWVLGTQPKDQIIRQMQINQRGEQVEN